MRVIINPDIAAGGLPNSRKTEVNPNKSVKSPNIIQPSIPIIVLSVFNYYHILEDDLMHCI